MWVTQKYVLILTLLLNIFAFTAVSAETTSKSNQLIFASTSSGFESKTLEIRQEEVVQSNPNEPKKFSLRGWVKSFYYTLKIATLKRYYSFFPQQAESRLAKLNVIKIAAKGREAELVLNIKLFGPENLISRLDQQSRQGEITNCHLLSHQIGKLSYQVLGPAALQKSNTLCSSGYIHGVIGALLNDYGTNNLDQKLTEVCEQSQTAFDRISCYHGAGHGLMAYTNNDLPASVNRCEELKIDYTEKRNCLLGVFMENVSSVKGGSIGNHPTKWLSKTDLHFPCKQLKETLEIQDPCYVYQAGWIYTTTNADKTKSATECLKAKEVGKEPCFFGLGQLTALLEPSNPQKVVENCTQITSEARYLEACLRGGQNSFMNYWDKDIKAKTLALCEAVPTDLKTKCLAKLDQRLIELTAR